MEFRVLDATPRLPLESWRGLIGFHPFHYWQLSNSSQVPITSQCNDLLRQYAWQDADAASRQEIQEATDTAEQRLMEELGYWPAPRYIEETVSWERFYQAALANYSRAGVGGRWQGIALSSGYIQALGVEDLNVISASSALTYSDLDNDGLGDTWTLGPVATTVTDVKRIAIYFVAADRFDGTGVSERWRVMPVQVSISGGNVTVKGRRWQTVKPVLYEGISSGGDDGTIDPDDDANFVTALALYERTTDGAGTTTTTSQAAFIWETNPWPAWAACCGNTNGDSSSDPSATAQGIARANIRDSRLGIVGIGSAVYDATTDVWSSIRWDLCQPPDRVLVRYCAGYPLDSEGHMDAKFRTIVARMAAAELPKPRCGDGNGNRALYHWQFDLARAQGQMDEQYQISPADLDNPWGTRRGHVYAWKQVQKLKTRRGINA